MWDAVIFDFDGVIGDTMQDNYNAWKKAFNDYDVDITELDYFLLEGMGRRDIAQFFISKNKWNQIDVDTVVEKKESYYKENNQFKIFPYVEEILLLLKTRGKKLGLVTGASRNRIEMTLIDELKSYFKVIVTSDDVKKTKPHPEPYLTAMHFLDCTPKNTLVIENAKLGIESAKNAGAVCWAIETTVSKEYLSKADKAFKTHLDLLEVLNSKRYG